MNSKKILRGIVIVWAFLSVHDVAFGQTAAKEEKINFTSFTINSNQKRVIIDWATDNKVPTNYFEIEKSIDGMNFETIALVLGPDPKKTNCDCYEGFDKPGLNTKKYFYRLKHVSINGEIELSETKMLAVNEITFTK